MMVHAPARQNRPDFSHPGDPRFLRLALAIPERWAEGVKAIERVGMAPVTARSSTLRQVADDHSLLSYPRSRILTRRASAAGINFE